MKTIFLILINSLYICPILCSGMLGVGHIKSYDSYYDSEWYRTNQKRIERERYQNEIIKFLKEDDESKIKALKLFSEARRTKNTEIYDNAGLTPLLFAALEGQLEVVIVLVQIGANIEVTNPYNKTVIDLARNKILKTARLLSIYSPKDIQLEYNKRCQNYKKTVEYLNYLIKLKKVIFEATSDIPKAISNIIANYSYGDVMFIEDVVNNGSKCIIL